MNATSAQASSSVHNDIFSMTIERGTRLGPYEVVSQIGEGGMGVMWQARDTRLERVIAIRSES